jgi:hypothetical protein
VPERTAAQSDIGSKRPAHEGHATRVVAQQIGVRLIKGRLVEAVRSRHRSKPDAAGSGESPVNKCRKNFRLKNFYGCQRQMKIWKNAASGVWINRKQ